MSFFCLFDALYHLLYFQGAAVPEEDPFPGGGVPVMENGPQDTLEDTMVAPEDATESLLAATEPTSHASTPGGPPGPPAPEPLAPHGPTAEADEPAGDADEEGQGTSSYSAWFIVHLFCESNISPALHGVLCSNPHI